MLRSRTSTNWILRCVGALATMAFHLAANPARAGSIEVAPVLVEMVAPTLSSVLTVNNRGSFPVSAQIRAFAWGQDKSGDTLTPTRELLVSPPIFQIPSGASQMVRILLRQPPGAKDTAYRLLIDELPAPDSPDTVHLALRISLPVFARPHLRTAPAMQWHTLPSGRNKAEIVAVNTGSAAERVSDLTLALDRRDGWKAVALTNAWVLPGTERHWQVPTASPVDWRDYTRARLTAALRMGPMDVVAPIIQAP